MHTSPARAPWWRVLYIQVLLAVAAGILLGWLFPDTGKTLKPLGDGFIKLIKMMIAPVIFCTVVHGVASMGDLKKLGRVGGKTLLYFEVVSTLALVIGLVVVNLLKPGAGFNVEVADLGAKAADAAREYAGKAQGLSTVDFLLGIIPGTFVGAFAGGDLLQVLFIALLAAFGLAGMGERGKSLLHGIDRVSEVFFAIMRIVVKAAPVGAFGAMAFTIGSYGLESLQRLLALMLGFYITAGFFVVVVLGLIARWCGFSIFRFLAYIKEELLLVLGTSSSETALPLMIQKLRGLGCAPATVGLVVPTGYSFNLDGTNIYMAMAAVFLAQATNTPLDLGQQVSLLLVAMITSKGASGVTGAGFITLAATLAVVPGIPIESLALLVGIDRFMSECRALTNLIGNGVATVAISRWEGEVTPEVINANLRDPVRLPPPA
ncbi:MAG TPA: dicarboxylate/amino acid:cation symporter [Verrucomicrobiales bacterium]|nr:dicarboxylate/amino acid:cation symporter [Verrucomicrobiales bacterium]HRJ08795.1 dicarboxylate/amino acid:cation symporter [Prosthecobacter sp.]HRK13319.1 dicarboxylate/amino acid:cation symporter [Prosthecobacter sp.]